MLFVKNVTSEKRKGLEYLLRTTRDVEFYKRVQIILLSHQGKTVPEITKICCVHRDTVTRSFTRFEKFGIEGLKTKPRSGRPAKVKPKHVNCLLEDVRKSPRQFGYKVNNWTLAQLKEHMQKRMDLVLSLEHIRRLLKRGGISFRRPKLHLVSPDPDYSKKNFK